MSLGYWIVKGDKTTCGGTVLEGHPNGRVLGGNRQATSGCKVSCGKHSGTYSVGGGHPGDLIHGQRSASTLYSRSTCPCNAAFIPSMTWAKHGLYQVDNTRSTRQDNVIEPEQNQLTNQTNSRIRLDARHLMNCAADICEKHLYYPEVKAGFKQEIQSFADDIVQQVESNQMSYEQGSAELKKEEQSLMDQSVDWVINGLSILGGLGMTIAGFALCTTGGGCLIGAPLMAHGLNGMYEGGMGLYEGNSNVQGPLREGYKASAKALGFDESVGNLAYDLIDMGISVRGKLQLVPKLTKVYDSRKIKPFVLFRYGRKDLDYAFRQANKLLLSLEIAGDVINLLKIKDDIKDAFVLDKETGTIMLNVIELEKITNIEYVQEHCSLVITITGTDNSPPTYYMCEDKSGSKYNIDSNGELISGAIK